MDDDVCQKCSQPIRRKEIAVTFAGTSFPATHLVCGCAATQSCLAAPVTAAEVARDEAAKAMRAARN
jgi:hypothetical protein